MNRSWDIFCKVIDNYGDIGVSWRLASILHRDFGKQVRLFVDDLKALKTLVPETQLLQNQQEIQQINVVHWKENLKIAKPSGVVIEAFGCTLPAEFIEQMRIYKPIWINLEYFSAEPWVQDFHQQPSRQANGLDKMFFFPSILPATGGLMREADLLARKAAVVNSAHAWSDLGLPTPDKKSFKISLFAYENQGLESLLQIWSQSDQPIEVYLPNSRILTSALTVFPDLQPGQSYQLGQLTLHVLPFLPQNLYDHLLWLCDLNFVRGEESLVRAQWAGKPFIWHIYPTDDQAHWDKLHAFFEQYGNQLNPSARQALLEFNQAWNHQQLDDQIWSNFIAHYSELNTHADSWIWHLESLGELTSNMVKLVEPNLMQPVEKNV